MIKLSIIMPVYNEGVNLKNMLKILTATIEVPHEVLVVFDSLSDNSIPVIEEMQKKVSSIRPVHNQLGRGVKYAIQSGVKAAHGDYILILAADDIGPILAVDEMMSLMNDGCEFINATRYAYGGRVLGGARSSRLFSWIANRLFYYLGGAITDSTLGVKMIRKNIFKKFTLTSKPVGWAVAFELSIRAQLQGCIMGEVPIISINRFYGGKSSFKLQAWLVEYSKLFIWGLFQIYTRQKRKVSTVLKVPEKLIYERTFKVHKDTRNKKMDNF